MTSHIQPSPTSYLQHQNSPQSNTPQDNRLSNSILHGTEKLLALFQMERAKIEAHNREQLSELHARFQQFQSAAEKREKELSERLWELEGQLTGKGNQFLLITNEGTSYAPEGNCGSATNSSFKHIGTTSQDSTTPVLEDQMGSAVHIQLDINTIQLLQQLGIYTSQAAPQDPSSNDPTMAPNLVQASAVSSDFIPRLLQYLASHAKALQDWEEKYNAIKREYEGLRQTLHYVAPRPQSRLPNSAEPTHRHHHSRVTRAINHEVNVTSTGISDIGSPVGAALPGQQKAEI